jgi:hypothetical protein
VVLGGGRALATGRARSPPGIKACWLGLGENQLTRGFSKICSDLAHGESASRSSRKSEDEWAEFLQRVYRLETGGWLQELIGRPGWFQYVARADGEIVAARGMHIGPDGTAWLGMDGPVPGVVSDDYEADAALCGRGYRGALRSYGHARIRVLRPARLLAAVRPDALGSGLMHASIWRFRGDPDELLPAYESMLAEIPASNMRLHLCLRAPDGIVLVDTWPSREAFEGFVNGLFAEVRRRHGLPESERIEDFPVHAALVDGQRLKAPM